MKLSRRNRPGVRVAAPAALATLALCATLSFTSAPAWAGSSEAKVWEDDEIPTRGTWNLGTDFNDKKDRIWMSFELGQRQRGHHWNYGRSFSIDQLSGLTAADLDDDNQSVAFDLKRDAGTLHCRGNLDKGHGGGTFTIELDPGFADRLARRGVGRPDRSQQTRLLLGDGDEAMLDLLAREKYPTPNVELFVRMNDHGVNLNYVESMSQRGFKFGTISALIQARDHGVDAHFIDGMAKAGYRDLDFETLLRARDHGADPDFAASMVEAGFGELPLETLIRARDHGVDGEYAADLAELGYRKLSLEALIQARDHGVDAQFASGMHKAGFKDVSLQGLIRARDHGVSPGSARRMKERRGELSLDEIISLHDRGQRD